jgi:hypothetical protein
MLSLPLPRDYSGVNTHENCVISVDIWKVSQCLGHSSQAGAGGAITNGPAHDGLRIHAANEGALDRRSNGDCGCGCT